MEILIFPRLAHRRDDGFSLVPIEQNFISIFNGLFLKQLVVTVPTHNKGNILDIILTDMIKEMINRYDKPDLRSDINFVESTHGPCGTDHFQSTSS